MDIKHKILAFYSDAASLEVQFYTDSNPDGVVYRIDIPIVDGKYPTQEELKKFIIGYSPVWQMQRIEDIKTAVVPDYLAALEPKPEPTDDTQEA